MGTLQQNRSRRSPVKPWLWVAAFSLTGCGDPEARVDAVIGGEAQRQVLKNPVAALAYRIKSYERQEKPEEIIAGPFTLTPEQTDNISALLLAHGSYWWPDEDVSFGCLPVPGVLVVFENADGKSEVRLCFECESVDFEPGRSGQIGPIEDELIAWAQEVFPDDAVIQGLNHQGHSR